MTQKHRPIVTITVEGTVGSGKFALLRVIQDTLALHGVELQIPHKGDADGIAQLNAKDVASILAERKPTVHLIKSTSLEGMNAYHDKFAKK
ncbi:MAG: hypothetical protein LBK01_03430 [Burkholderiaceae bacterium]|jgi:Ni2+-binding GTPase involved in maturation of urease and hydrogenase|nr:hypothetical protein [Burkholderiaceae bacterium]